MVCVEYLTSNSEDGAIRMPRLLLLGLARDALRCIGIRGRRAFKLACQQGILTSQKQCSEG